MKIQTKILMLLAVMTATVFTVSAVTEKEMDQARAIAAKWYIRYVNDASGYLDNVSPQSMADLEKNLTTDKDRQNFKDFKNAGAPGQYSDWDKDQLVAYWSSTFFTDHKSALNAKGAENGACKQRIRKAIQSMTVTPPAAPEPEPAPVEPEQPKVDTPKAVEVIESGLDQIAEQISDADTVLTQQEEEMAAQPKKNSGTWVYIMILAILVVVVIFLVIYASKTMKTQPKKEAPRREDRGAAREPRRAEPRPVREQPVRVENNTSDDVVEAYVGMGAAKALEEAAAPVQPVENSETRMRERYAESLAEKSEEIRLLKRKVGKLEDKVDELTAENTRLKAEIERRNREAAYAPKNTVPEDTIVSPSRPQAEAAPREPRHELKEIYLGRVNSKGLFVRADRQLSPGHSVYRLATNNGLTGTFTVVEDPMMQQMALEEPGKWLAGGCVAKDLFDTEGRIAIRNEAAGTAIFEDGAWRVMRKAKIRYE